MGIFTRRPIDLARRAAAVAAEAGWAIERWGEGRREGDGVSIIVSGGELRGPALATVSVRDEDAAFAPDALWGVVSEHLPRTLSPPPLRSTRARGRALVVRLVEHPAGGTLDELLARRAMLAVGQAVTVLVAVARGLADLHACGRAGVGLTTHDVGFRHDGCPVLMGIDTVRPLDHDAAKADVKAYAILAATVCAAVGGAPGAALLAAATAVGHRRWEDVIRAVLCTADPIAVAWQQEAHTVVQRRDTTPVAEDAVSAVSWSPELEASAGREAVRSAEGERRAASPEVIPWSRADDEGFVPPGTAPLPATRHRASSRQAKAPARDPAGGDRMLRAVERLLDGIGDRPVRRAMGVVRAWAVARPLVVAVALVPVAAVLLAVVLFPPAHDGGDAVGKSSSAPFRESGTGPNRCEFAAGSHDSCDG